jgi:hypothetical protein
MTKVYIANQGPGAGAIIVHERGGALCTLGVGASMTARLAVGVSFVVEQLEDPADGVFISVAPPTEPPASGEAALAGDSEGGDPA